MDETSLTDFLGDANASGEDEATTESVGAGPHDVAESDSTTAESVSSEDENASRAAAGEGADQSVVDEGSVDPAESTAAWSRAGVSCAACGEATAWRWRDAGALLCEDCKSW